MGYQVGNQCLETASLADDFYYSALAPTQNPYNVSVNGNYLLSFPNKDAGVWKYKHVEYYPATGSIRQTVQTTIPAKTYPSCTWAAPATNSEAFFEGHVLGWGVAAAMVAAWAILAMRRGLS